MLEALERYANFNVLGAAGGIYLLYAHEFQMRARVLKKRQPLRAVSTKLINSMVIVNALRVS